MFAPGCALLAPLAGVSDAPFRSACISMGADGAVTEMVSAKGLLYNNSATKALLYLAENETKTGVQLFGSEPESLRAAVKLLNQSNFAFIDINMGCPVKKVVKSGDGSALMGNLAKMREVAQSVVDASTKPVSAKIRLGVDEKHLNAIEAAALLEQCGIGMLTIHGRTAAMMYSGLADRGQIARVVESVSIPVLANGDITSVESYADMRTRTNAYGVMVGRGAMGNPFIFRAISEYRRGEAISEVDINSRIELIYSQLAQTIALKGEYTACREFRKQLGWYTKGMKNGARLRAEISTAESFDDFAKLIEALRLPPANV